MQPNIYFAHEHTIDKTAIDPEALFVVQRLKEKGFIAYLVGGSVRDLLLKKKPKDFDISTNARPEEIKSIFGRNCLLIGRRFRLAHVRFGHKTLEVSTFRAGESPDSLIVRDNIFGTEEEDVLRRDFTMNGLFFDPEKEAVIDFVGGMADVKQGVLKVIGDPLKRFKQDPVRMLRLLKFRARFGFDIDSEAKKGLILCKHEITKSSPARILEELFRMLESGSSLPFFQLLHQSGFLKILIPFIDPLFKEPIGKEILHFLSLIDQMKERQKSELDERGVLLGAFVYPIIQEKIRTQFLDKNETPHINDISHIISITIEEVFFHAFSHFPRKIAAILYQTMMMQYRLTPLTNKKVNPLRLMKGHDFALGFAFLQLRAFLDPKDKESYLYWKNEVKIHHKNVHKKYESYI